MATISQAAAACDLSVVRFRELVDAGVIAKQPSGQYDLDVTTKTYIRHLRAKAAGRSGEDGGASLSKQRADLAHEQTMAVRFKNAVMRGDYVSLGVIRKHGETMLMIFRERVLSIPGKVADRCAMRTREEIDMILREELYEALDELSNPAAFGGSGERGNVPPDVPGGPPAPEAKPN